MRYVYCHPLFDERKCAARFSYALKTAFDSAGLTLKRFDYRGTGEADGDHADVSLDSLRQDVAAQAGDGKTCLIGLRFGATLAFDCSVRRPQGVERVILLAPVVHGGDYVEYLCRKQHIKDLMSEGAVDELAEDGYRNLEGYKTSEAFLSQIASLELSQMAPTCASDTPICLCEIQGRSRADPSIGEFIRDLKASHRELLVDSVRLPVFWERVACHDYTELTRKVLSWCCR